MYALIEFLAQYPAARRLLVVLVALVALVGAASMAPAHDDGPTTRTTTAPAVEHGPRAVVTLHADGAAHVYVTDGAVDVESDLDGAAVEYGPAARTAEPCKAPMDERHVAVAVLADGPTTTADGTTAVVVGPGRCIIAHAVVALY